MAKYKPPPIYVVIREKIFDNLRESAAKTLKIFYCCRTVWL